MKQARKALARGHPDEAVALLWNAIEPARLAGDRRALATIEHLALSLSREGDTSQRHEAEKLLTALRGASEEAARPETGRNQGEILTAAQDGEPVGEEKVGTQAGRAVGLSTIIWLLTVIAIVILNILGQGRGQKPHLWSSRDSTALVDQCFRTTTRASVLGAGCACRI